MKSYRSHNDPSVCYIHSKEDIEAGSKIKLDGQRHKVQSVTHVQPSKYWPEHKFYEVRI